MREVPNTLVHFYRATVMHADVWRQRLDATTNWAVVSTAAIVTFSFSSPLTPHFILLLAFVFGGFFLVMETRRYQMFDLWRQRVRMLNRYLIAPALDPSLGPSDEETDRELSALGNELGSTIPHLSFLDALGYRLRRNYGLLFGAVLATWLLKLWYHPVATGSLEEYVERAAVGLAPGPTIFLGVALGTGALVFVAFRARTEQMHEWTELPSPLRRALHRTVSREIRERETSLLSEEGLRNYERTPAGLPDLLSIRRGLRNEAGEADEETPPES